MKKILLFASALAGLFLAGSCQRENLEPVQQGNTVTYTVTVPDALATKADGDGFVAYYEVYRQGDVEDGTKSPIYEGSKPFENGSANIELEFVKNQNFVVLFWAQKEGVTAYNTGNLRNVTLNSDLTANQANYEVFAGMDEVSNCVSSNNGNVELVRPIAQLNIATDAEGLKLGDTDVTLISSFVTVKGLSTTYNVYNKAVSETLSDVEFSVAAVPDGELGTTDYTYVAMNYIGFIDANGTTVNVDFTVKTSEGDIAHSVSSVPVKPNYKTNIIGNLITATDNYNVTLGDWGTPETNVQVVSVSTAQDLQEAIENIPTGSEGNIILEGNIDLGTLFGASTLAVTKTGNASLPIVIPEGKTMTLDLNGFTITTPWEAETAGKHYYAFENYGTLNIVDSKVNGKIKARGIFNYGKMTLESGTIEACDGNGGYGVRNYDGAEFVMNGGTVATIYEDGDIPGEGYDACPIRVDEGAKVEINGGIIENVSNFTVNIDNYGETIVNDGTFTSVHTTLANSAVMTINGGSFTCNGLEGITAHALWAAAGTTTIKGGTFDGKDNYNGFNVDASAGAVVNITGGKFLPVHSGSLYGDGTISVTGGEFFDDPSDYVANGYVAKQNENNLWTIVPAPAVVEGGYEISNAAQLKYFAESVNAGETTYNGTTIKLAADIDLQNEPWTPIGFNSNSVAGSEKYFAGTFDGQNHTIRNLKIDVKDQGGVGLFGTVYNASFKNFTLENVDIKAVESEDDPANTSGAENHSNYIVGGHTGAVVGYDAKAGEVNFENVHVKGLVRIEGETRAAQGQRIGGIIGGRGSSKMTFKNVSVKGTDGSYIKGYCSTAGVSGQIQDVATYENVHTDIDVYAVTFGAGGIAGIVRQGSTFTNCSSAGDITLDASKTQLSSYSANYPYRVGGIAGCWSESATGVLTLTDCTYTGNLTSIDRDENTPQTLDYAGYVGRGYTLKGCAGSKVVIDGVEYVQAYNTAAEAGIYIVDGVLEIASAAALRTLATNVNNGKTFEGKTVKLANDIDLNDEEWIPIGSATADHGFMGNFDGNGKTIRNLKMTGLAPDADNYVYAGLFGVTEGTSPTQENYIKNLVIENVTIDTKGHIAAAAIAYPYYTTVENITVKGNINIKGGDYTSGALAYTRRCINAKNITVEGNEGSSIEGNNTVGGVISDIQMNGGLTADYSNFKASGLTIKGNKCVGGISGIISGQTLDGATVENVSLESDDVRTGIIAGSLGSKSTIKNIKVTNVTGADKVVGATYDDGREVTVNGDEYCE